VIFCFNKVGYTQSTNAETGMTIGLINVDESGGENREKLYSHHARNSQFLENWK